MGKQWKQWQTFFLGAPKSLQVVTATMKLKHTCSLEESYDQPRQYIKKQRHYFVNKGPSSQSCGFSSSHLWKWELDYKESWVLKNWFFWTVVFDKTLQSPLDYKQIQPVHPKGNQCWPFIGRTDNVKSKMKVPLSCLTLCDPTDCIVHGILLARLLEWVAFPFSRVSCQPRD